VVQCEIDAYQGIALAMPPADVRCKGFLAAGARQRLKPV